MTIAGENGYCRYAPGECSMKIRSTYTNRAWLEPTQQQLSGAESGNKEEHDPARHQIDRALSEVVRCQNLVVLTGLGTSLCVMDNSTPPRRKAPTMWDLWERVSNKYDSSKNKAAWGKLLKDVKHPAGNSNIEELLSACKVAASFFSGAELTTLQGFISLAEKEIRDAVNFLDGSDALTAHGVFLQRIARRSAGKGRVKLFTTNYDLCFEYAAKNGRFVVIDGFSPTLPPTFDPVYFSYDIVRRGNDGDASSFIPNVFHLYKLHGSIDWERGSVDIEKKHNTDKPLLIYPRSSKYEQVFSQPYLEMIAALQSALREPNTGLVVIGFGFNDNHIAEPVLSAIRSNLGLKVVIVDPFLCERFIDGDTHLANGGKETELNPDGKFRQPGNVEKNLFLRNIQTLMDQGDVRLSFLNASFEEIGREIPDLTAETDLEKHMNRIRSIQGGSE